MLKTTSLAMGQLRGTIYDFEKQGDELPIHTHTEDDVHISIVAKGSFHMFGQGWEKNIETGAVLDWNPGVFHGFKSLEDDSRLINIIKTSSK